MKKLPNKFNTENLPDNFKKQISETINNLIDCVKELQEKIEKLSNK